MIPSELYTEIKRSFPINAVELIVLNKEQEVLLFKRTNEPAKGQWWIPGGRVRFAETRLDAAKRLLKEECGVVCEHFLLEGMFDYMVKNEQDNYDQHTITTVYRVQIENQEIYTDFQSCDYSWKHPEEWMKYVESDFLKQALNKHHSGAFIPNRLSSQNFTSEAGFIRKELYHIILESLPIPCVDLLIKNQKGEILLVKRRNEPAKDKWWVPGGRVLHGERRIDAAKRKLNEECGLGGNAFREIGSFEFIFNTPENKTYHNIATLFEVEIDNEATVMLDEQSDGYCWKAAEEWLKISLDEFVKDMLQKKRKWNKIYS